jgi:hypothetical protein
VGKGAHLPYENSLTGILRDRTNPPGSRKWRKGESIIYVLHILYPEFLGKKNDGFYFHYFIMILAAGYFFIEFFSGGFYIFAEVVIIGGCNFFSRDFYVE